MPGGLPTELFIAWIIVAKFGDHLPFYRQAEIFKRQGIDLDRGTLGNWVGRACFHLMPIIHHMKAHLRGADRIFVDETRAPVLEPGLKRTKSGYFWAVVSDDRGHGGAGPPIVLFHYAPGRGKEHPLKFLAGYQGRFLQCDAYQSYNAMTEIARDNGPWQLVYCWTHVRRRFVKRFESDASPIAEEMLRQIALLYQIEKTVRGTDANVRLAARREHSAPIIAALKPWLEAQLSRIPQKSQLAEDIRYTLAHWSGLIRFLEDGTIELDTNPVENQIRPIALTRKNALFAGNEIGAENWAMLASLVIRRNNSAPRCRFFRLILQDGRREPGQLHRSHAACHPRRPSQKPHRRTDAVALRSAGRHEFDLLCADLGIEHRLAPPAHPQTNGMVERFNGRIEEVLQSHHFRSGEELQTTLHRYVALYNQQLPQSALGGKALLQAMKTGTN
ncbi:MAG: IS66 family transposase [Rhodobacteraceae bacterium]|nr:IS66 family transposase [Paracoccaceae bacterium]